MGKAFDDRRASDVMRRDLVTVDASMSLREAVEVLRGAGVSGAPVLRGSRLVGVLSSTDLVEFEATSPDVPRERRGAGGWTESERVLDEDEMENPSAFFFGRREDAADVWERMNEPDRPEWDHLEQRTVEEIMSRDLVTVSADTPVSKAAGTMLEHRIHRVLVVAGADLIGMISALDLVKLVAEAG